MHQARHLLTGYLKRCHNQHQVAQGEDGGAEMWVLRPGARIPVEGELRKIITPDAWCTHESMKRGVLHLKDAGLGTQAVLAQVPQDRLRLMFEALPPSPVRFCPDSAMALKEVICS